MVKSAKGTAEEPGNRVAQKAGLNRAIAGEAWGRTVGLLAYKTADRGGLLVTVPAPGTSLRCSECGRTTAGSRESQAMFVCKNPECGWIGNADHKAGRNIDRAGLALAGCREGSRRAGMTCQTPPERSRGESLAAQAPESSKPAKYWADQLPR
ncbi:transposase [Actinacidiphila soli]|uniref:transposase n=1 Tax=Actinacidiphila soli TaxID=2487275 RepID=UPI001F0BDF54|nr:transposase [Actinacidiphila soli]